MRCGDNPHFTDEEIEARNGWEVLEAVQLADTGSGRGSKRLQPVRAVSIQDRKERCNRTSYKFSVSVRILKI